MDAVIIYTAAVDLWIFSVPYEPQTRWNVGVRCVGWQAYLHVRPVDQGRRWGT